MSTKIMNMGDAILDATKLAMRADKKVICFGLGVDDPKRIFGTTTGLVEEFGSERVFDTPTAENAMTGVAIGLAMGGYKPIVTHQRLDFFLLALDQLVNNAAKWHYMFGGQTSIPITIRLLIGHGWGQGPTHSQNLQSWFAHVPGLKVVMPSHPAQAKSLLLSSIFDPNPVVFLEHRWLHNTQAEVPLADVREPIGKARIARKGKDLTIVALSYMTIEALRAADCLAAQGIDAEVIDLQSVQPIDFETVKSSVRKTGRLLAVDTASEICSVASEIVAHCSSNCFSQLKTAPMVLAQPNVPSPTSFALTKVYYKRAEDIVLKAAEMLDKSIYTDSIVNSRGKFHDVPGEWFKGPF